jgi:hypothetical protein
MFEGVLDNGEDAIFLGNESKFTAMIDTLGDMMDEEEKAPAASQPAEPVDDEPEPAKETAPGLPESPSSSVAPETSVATESSVAPETPSAPSSPSIPSPTEPRQLVAQGISFLSGLAQTLQSPEATAQLVETLVETDAKTGQTSLRIPVPDKQTVRNLLDIVGKLFG